MYVNWSGVGITFRVGITFQEIEFAKYDFFKLDAGKLLKRKLKIGAGLKPAF